MLLAEFLAHNANTETKKQASSSKITKHAHIVTVHTLQT